MNNDMTGSFYKRRLILECLSLCGIFSSVVALPDSSEWCAAPHSRTRAVWVLLLRLKQAVLGQVEANQCPTLVHLPILMRCCDTTIIVISTDFVSPCNSDYIFAAQIPYHSFHPCLTAAPSRTACSSQNCYWLWHWQCAAVSVWPRHC